jgi:hypothetical protein
MVSFLYKIRLGIVYWAKNACLFLSNMNMLTWSLDVADDASGLVIHEFNTDLRDTTARAYFSVPFKSAITNRKFQAKDSPFSMSASCFGRAGKERTSSAQDAGNLYELNGNFASIHICDY